MIVAALDVGTNSVLMLLARLAAGSAPVALDDLCEITRLGRGVDRTGRLDPESARRTLATIARFAAQARARGAERTVAVATSAMREAADGPEFVAAVARQTGVQLEVISGQTEASLNYVSAVKGLGLDPAARLLILDVGGGSTELITAAPGSEPRLASLALGSVRLTERLVRSDPPTLADQRTVRAAVKAELSQLGWTFKPEIVVGVAGTVTTLCAVSRKLAAYDAGRVHGQRLSRAEIEATTRLLARLPHDARLKLPGMVEGRADVIFAGAAIVDCVMEACGAAELVVSDHGVRWGLVWREAEKLFRVGGAAAD